MELDEFKNPDFAQINTYEPGKIIVNRKPFHHSLIIRGNEITPWTPKSLDQINDTAIEALLIPKIDLLLIGTGEANSVILPPSAMKTLIGSGIPYECMGTMSACHTWTLLAAEGRDVVAALIINQEVSQ
ncbi:MAG: hypothetical protein CMF48_02095 [Legionellales bacterium]|nr:hypothetical protein [Legionellales bacterium]|tara:strand:- start:692 stop:1078 length:387 start_codon:yes stop_codon:yes gene_type:complete